MLKYLSDPNREIDLTLTIRTVLVGVVARVFVVTIAGCIITVTTILVAVRILVLIVALTIAVILFAGGSTIRLLLVTPTFVPRFRCAICGGLGHLDLVRRIFGLVEQRLVRLLAQQSQRC